MISSFMKRWGIFIRERFSPASYSMLILSFLLGNGMLAIDATGNGFPVLHKAGLIAIATFLIFFHLRLFDERKDHETDLKLHPERPLARGVVNIAEVKRMGWAIIFLEILFSFFIGWQAFFGIVLVVGFSLLMLNEFFVGKWLRPQMELYAVTHTFVSVFMSLFVFSAISSLYVWQVPFPGLIYALDAWLIFTIFEFARKTYAPEEEKENVDSYSKRLGRIGAVSVVLLMAVFSFALVLSAGEMIRVNHIYFYVLLLLLIILAVFGTAYIRVPGILSAKLYRLSVSLYMMMFYLALGLTLLYKHTTL